MSTAVRLCKDTYLDSVLQLSGTRAMRAVPGIAWAAAAMATPANLITLADEGFALAELAGAGANDLFIAVRYDDPAARDIAFDAGEIGIFRAKFNVVDLKICVDRQKGSQGMTLARHLRFQVKATNVVVGIKQLEYREMFYVSRSCNDLCDGRRLFIDSVR